MSLVMALRLTISFADSFADVLDEVAETSGLHSRAEAARFLCARGLEAMSPARAQFRMVSKIDSMTIEEIQRLADQTAQQKE